MKAMFLILVGTFLLAASSNYEHAHWEQVKVLFSPEWAKSYIAFITGVVSLLIAGASLNER